MTLGATRQTLAQRLLADYHATGRLPRISGGDHEGGGDGESGDSGAVQGDQNSNANSGGEQGDGSGESNGFRPIASQAELDNIIGKRLDRERKKIAKDLEREVREAIEAEARQSEAEQQGNYKKLFEELQLKHEELEAQLAARELDDTRRDVAKRVGVPDDLVEFIKGDTEDDMEASAKALVKHITKPVDAPDTDAGRRGQGGGKRRDDTPPYRFGTRPI